MDRILNGIIEIYQDFAIIEILLYREDTEWDNEIYQDIAIIVLL